MMTTALFEQQCPKCKYTFLPRVRWPKRCTHCGMKWPLGKPQESKEA